MTPQPTLLPFDLAKAKMEGIKIGWRSAITLANNVCVQISDRLRDDDGPCGEVHVSADCAKRIREFIEPDEGYMSEMTLADSAQEAGAEFGNHSCPVHGPYIDLKCEQCRPWLFRKGGDAECAHKETKSLVRSTLETNGTENSERPKTSASDRPAEVQPLSAGQRDPNYDDEMKAAREELAELKKGAKINTHVRLFDLVRYQRAELHEAGLITDAEYAWLCAEAPMSKSPKGGSPSRQRLEDYDELRAKLTTTETHAKSLEGRVKELEKLTERVFGNHRDVEGKAGWDPAGEFDFTDLRQYLALLRPATPSGFVPMPPQFGTRPHDMAVGPCACGATHRLKDWPPKVQAVITATPSSEVQP